MKKFSSNEKRLIGGMSLLMFIRMLGVSMIAPILSIFATNLDGGTVPLAGLAIGIFGISQTIFQIPMGRLSDRWGRKEVILLGFGIYLIGTILCGLSSNIYFLTIARFIAGAGAVSAVALTWITDGINVKWRNTAIAYFGMSIGAAVIVGFSLSSIIAGKLSASHVFYFCTAMTFIAIIYTVCFLKNNDIPQYRSDRHEVYINRNSLREILKKRDLLRLNMIGFISNFCFIGIMFIMPILISEKMKIIDMWKILAPTAVIGTASMFYFARKADKIGTVKIAIIGFACEIIGLCIPLVSQNIYFLFISFIFFYSGHCILSPILPVAVSRFPEKKLKGTVMGTFTSSQYIGMGLGGVLSGFIIKFSPEYLFITLAILVLIAVVIILGFKDFKGEVDDWSIGSPLDSID